MVKAVHLMCNLKAKTNKMNFFILTIYELRLKFVNEYFSLKVKHCL
jgi:hypothetical protein